MIMVDELKVHQTRIQCFKNGSCHLTTDGDIQELHMFAAIIGCKRAWFQDHPTHPHYDLTTSRREDAVRRGAVFVAAREQARRRIEKSLSGPRRQL